jgi:hypothetical protein
MYTNANIIISYKEILHIDKVNEYGNFKRESGKLNKLCIHADLNYKEF